MDIHIFISENLYTFRYLKFLEGNFDLSSSLFVFKKASSESLKYSDSFAGKIVYTQNNIQFFASLLPQLRRSSRILFHQLPHGPSLILWNLFPWLISKITWIIWGGDVYQYRKEKVSLTDRLYEICRRRIIKRIKRIASFIPGDFEIIRKTYNTKAEYLQSMYPLPVDFLHYSKPETDRQERPLRILAGNSGNPSNLHAEILEKLEPLRDSDIKIYCPLSYSGNSGYVKSVTERGKEIFGDKFIAITKLVDPGQYLELLYDTDVAIMNHDRQQGLGNILPLLYFCKKVFLKSGTTTFKYLESTGCTVFDISAISVFDASLFDKEKNKLEKNREIIGNLLSEDRCRKLWERILE